MGERYDVLVRLGDGAFPLVALPEGKPGTAFAIIRTAGGRAPAATARPAELSGRVLTVAQMRATAAITLPNRRPDRTHRVVLGGSMTDYRWTINGAPSTGANCYRSAPENGSASS